MKYHVLWQYYIYYNYEIFMCIDCLAENGLLWVMSVDLARRHKLISGILISYESMDWSDRLVLIYILMDACWNLLAILWLNILICYKNVTRLVSWWYLLLNNTHLWFHHDTHSMWTLHQSISKTILICLICIICLSKWRIMCLNLRLFNI